MNRVVVSSWALHRTLGVSYPDSPADRRPADSTVETRHGATSLPLTQLPAALAEHGYDAMQLCHFHLPSRTDAYLSELKAALAASGVRLHALLIDDGDVSHPITGERDAAWIGKWLGVAEALGAENARVIAGKQPRDDEAFASSAARLRALADGTTVRIQTENWFDLLATPEAVNELLDRLEGRLGLCADFGNWPRPRKYADLPGIMRRAEACHAKFEFTTPETLDAADADACMNIAFKAAYSGPYVIVNGGIGDSEWDALAVQRKRLLAA